MMNKKRRFTYGFFIFLLCLGIIYVISRSFAYEVITKTDQNVTNAEVKNVSDTADYAIFSVKKKDNNNPNDDVVGAKITIKINKTIAMLIPAKITATIIT